MPLLVDCVKRFDETQEEDAQAVHDTLGRGSRAVCRMCLCACVPVFTASASVRISWMTLCMKCMQLLYVRLFVGWLVCWFVYWSVGLFVRSL